MIVVTGALGFIGSALVWELNEQGESDILCSDSLALSDRPEALEKRSYRSFLGHKDLLRDLGKRQIKPKAVFHMGACSSTTETNWEFLRENNLEYSQRIFEACTELKVPLIYASSAAVYGDGSLGYSDEKDPSLYEPLNLYGKSKRDFDVWALKQTSAPPKWFGLRFFNVYGPNESHKGEMRSLVCKAFEQIQATGRLKLFRSNHPDFKDGEQKRDFVYVKDVGRWMCELLAKNGAANGIYNMGTGEARTWLDLAKSAFLSLNRPMQIEWMDIPAPISGQYQNFTQADMSKWRSQGLSSVRYSLESGVKDYIETHLVKGVSYL